MAFYLAELDLLIYKYLQESKFSFTACTFGNESNLLKLNIKGDPKLNIKNARISAGALIDIIGKGIKYAEIEFNKDIEAVNQKTGLSLIEALNPNEIALRDQDTTSTLEDIYEVEFPSSKVTVLGNHNMDAYICAWNPTSDLLATAAGDSTAIIWNMNSNNSFFPNQFVITHNINADNLSVTSLEWNNNGLRLATGTFDGYSRIWTPSGQLNMKLGKQKGPIFALKWNKSGNYLLSAGMNKIKVWNTTSGQCAQKFKCHTKSVIDVDWMDNEIFASCSTDNYIHVCRLGVNNPIKSFQGHTDKINAIQCDPKGSLLASCSDDGTLKIWSMLQNTCVHDLRGHSGKIYMIKWTLVGYRKLILASASEDSTIRLWDADTGFCIYTLANHTSDVFHVAFSPDGRFLASGSNDKYVYIWSTIYGILVYSYKSTGIVWSVCWNQSGDKVGFTAGDGSVCIMNLSS